MDSLQARDVVLLGDRRWQLHRLDRLGVDHLPFTLKVLLENLLRHEDGQLVTVEQVEAVRRWDPTAERRDEVDLHPTRVFLHDTNGVPALVDLAAMRDALAGLGGDPQAVNPLIPAELVADHSVIADVFGRPDARDRNVELEYARNSERYRFLKWGQAALVLPYVLRSLLGSSNCRSTDRQLSALRPLWRHAHFTEGAAAQGKILVREPIGSTAIPTPRTSSQTVKWQPTAVRTAFVRSLRTVRGEVRRSDTGLRTGRLCAEAAL